ncbi:MAG: 4Fe-4S binding protein [Bacteroidales bacterium]|jgi:polyferredoxin|nr:4Fe-4S binding protein [Bacteroidales bacterium]MCK9499118.1 4Fe-4S binding protein [Bacteroidales bacterium]NLB85880.1 4Fe-4S binding protein [Bacteroidales bacterium]
MKKTWEIGKKGVFITAIILSAILLSIPQIKLENPILLSERFFPGYGWIQIAIMSILAGFIAVNMLNINKISRWRTATWTIFSLVFFSQLALGLLGYEKFLMTGKLHLPIPAVVIAGAVYRFEIGFMPFLFLTTVLITGPAWCSQLCYFGSFDNLTSRIKKNKKRFRPPNLKIYRSLALTIFIIIVLILRFINLSLENTVIIAGVFGILGLLIILFVTPFIGKMTHCIYWCPLGAVLNYSRKINPFKMYIDKNCINCMRCTAVCKYQAMEKTDLLKQKPGFTCTMCGDCIKVCPTDSIKYKLWNFSSENSRKIYIIIISAIYIVFLNMARI